MAKKKFVCTNIVCKNPNLNLILSLIAVVWLWRGIWGLTDAVVFASTPFDLEHLLGYGVPILIGIAYLYFNDYSISELTHGTPND
ncbi:MAG: hypothetical protein RL150_616 [Candidatus Parcubacteria bacterium]|jgi:hypothetical protein